MVVFKPRPLSVLGFCYAKLSFAYILFLSTQRGYFTSILPKRKGKREKGILSSKKSLLGDLWARNSFECASYSLSLNLGKQLPHHTCIYYHLERDWACPTPLSQVIIERITKFNQKEESPETQHSYSKLIFISWISSNVQFVSLN